MLPISSQALSALKKSAPLSIEMTVSPVSGESFPITNKDILNDSFSIERASVSGEKIEIGSAIASEMKASLDNHDGRFNSRVFEGAEIYVDVKVRISESLLESVYTGYFTVDEPPRRASSIELSALDRMVQFDRIYTTTLTYPANLNTILADCCAKCNVPQGTMALAVNGTHTVADKPEGDNLTYRQVIQWIGELSRTCAYIDNDGALRMKWYSTTNTEITQADRFTSTVEENDITITGVSIIANDEDGTMYLAGTTDYAFNIEGNHLAQDSFPLLTANLGAELIGFTYRPFKADTICYPHIEPLDKITYIDLDGTAHNSIVTSHTFRLNGRSELRANGESAQKQGYAQSDPLTKRERLIIERQDMKTDVKLSAAQQASIDFNKTIANSMGLYLTQVDNPNGSFTLYYHDKSTLDGSSYIFTLTSGGFAWTDDWNGGNPIWSYGITKNGNAVLNAISAYTISADYVRTGRIQTLDGTNYIDLDNGTHSLANGKFTFDGADAKIGNWDIYSTYLQNKVYDGSTFKWRTGMQAAPSENSAAFYAGCTTESGQIVGKSKFVVTQDGRMTAQDATIEGVFTARGQYSKVTIGNYEQGDATKYDYMQTIAFTSPNVTDIGTAIGSGDTLADITYKKWYSEDSYAGDKLQIISDNISIYGKFDEYNSQDAGVLGTSAEYIRYATIGQLVTFTAYAKWTTSQANENWASNNIIFRLPYEPKNSPNFDCYFSGTLGEMSCDCCFLSFDDPYGFPTYGLYIRHTKSTGVKEYLTYDKITGETSIHITGSYISL